MANIYSIIVGMPEHKRLLSRPMYRLEDNIVTQQSIAEQRIGNRVPAATNINERVVAR